MTPDEPYFEKLQTCQYGVANYGHPSCESECGEPAASRCTWDGGKTWLYLCSSHARKVEQAEEEVTP